MKSFLFSLTFLFFSLVSNCQENYIRALIVTINDDTIICLAPSALTYEDKMRVIKSDGKRETIHLRDIKYFADGRMVFENVQYKKYNRTVSKLLWMDIEGKMNLYCEFAKEPDVSFRVPGGYQSYFHGLIKTYVIKKNDSTYLVNEEDFLNSVRAALDDAPELLGRVEKGEFTYASLKDLVQAYNKLFEAELP